MFTFFFTVGQIETWGMNYLGILVCSFLSAFFVFYKINEINHSKKHHFVTSLLG